MLIKIINAVLILIAVFMGLKQGYAMLTAKPEMMEIFGKWNFSKNFVLVCGLITILSALLILHPVTFIWGNFLMAATILFIICFHLHDKNFGDAAKELPFLLINLIIIYLQYPLTRQGALSAES